VTTPPARLERRLGLGDAVVIGLGSMLGAGVFAAFAPAAGAAGSALLLALAGAAVVAFCNATSSARLAARYPDSGGTYIYGRRRLGDFWGFLAGWGFVVGKTASCAAMALTVGTYVWPAGARPVAVVAVVALTALNWFGVHRSAAATRVIVVVVLCVLGLVVASAAAGDRVTTPQILPGHGSHGGVGGLLQAAAFLFFAFAGYARIATLGEEVRRPSVTIPRAIQIALASTLVVYAAVALAVLAVLGPARLAASTAPLADAVGLGPWPALEPVVRVGAALAATGSLLALILGVSRTTLAMARDGHLPSTLAAVHPRHRVPHHAELAVGALVTVVVLVADVRGAIGFSSFAVLAYYAIANASAWTLDRRVSRRAVPAVGLAGCVALALALPPASTAAGLGVLAAGALLWRVRRAPDRPPT
jgi:APA family basic amino acid/polyamine antiporter